jgi:hypothetical protein
MSFAVFAMVNRKRHERDALLEFSRTLTITFYA